MEFRLFSNAPLSFHKELFGRGGMTTKFTKIAYATAGQLEKETGCSSKFLGHLEGLLVQPSTGIKRRRLTNSQLLVELQWIQTGQAGSVKGRFRIQDDDESEDDSQPSGHGLLARLVRICGGFENVKVDLELKFGTSGDTMTLTRKDKRLNDDSYSIPLIIGSFDFNNSLKEDWKGTKFTGKLTLTVKLNQEAMDQILEKSHRLNFGAVNEKLLEQAEVFGDVVILLENGVRVKCHKGILAAQSNEFQAMFTSGMKETGSVVTVEMRDVSEDGVRALLAYLYCGDIKEPVRCSVTAVELLTIANKYRISKLFKTMNELVLEKEDEWFSVAAALNLWTLGRIRSGISANPMYFKEMEAKARGVLKMKSTDELEECTKYKEMLSDPETAFELCTYFMQN